MHTQSKARQKSRGGHRRRPEWMILCTMAMIIFAAFIFGDKNPTPSQLPSEPELKEQLYYQPETAALEETEPEATVLVPDPVLLGSEHVGLIDIWQTCECGLNLHQMLDEPLRWNMKDENFQVLILHSHISESYTPGEEDTYTVTDNYRTNDPNYNMVAIGKRVAQILQANGISVLHDTNSYESFGDSSAYQNARPSIQAKLQSNPNIQLVIDIHRDAARTESGNQWGPTITVNGAETAQLSFVVGTGCNDGGNSNWKRNMAYAAKLEAQLDQMYPELCRQTMVSGLIYNQDLDATCLLAEVGLAGNTFREAMRAADCLALGIVALAHGTIS